MKKILALIAAVALTGVLVVSCFDDDTIDSPLCVITSFAVDDIETEFTVMASDSTDSTFTWTIDGDDVYFNIDQVNNRIYSVDSIVYWADITRVIPIIGYSGYLYIRTGDDSIAYSFTSGSDSVDFTQYVEFIVVAYDGSDAKIYTAELYKAETAEDSVYWTEQTGGGLSVEGNHRAVVLDDYIYVFAEGDGTPTVCCALGTDSLLQWTEPVAVEGTEGTLDYASVTIWDGSFYALDDGGLLYRSTLLQGGQSWTRVSDLAFDRLLCADDAYLYAYDGVRILATADLVTWEENGTDSLDYLPESPVSYAAYDFRTNEALQNVVMMGLSEGNDEYAVAWFKVSSADSGLDQQWAYVNISADNDYGMPKRDNLQMFRFNNVLYAFGKDDTADDLVAVDDDETSGPYGLVYKSNDNGVTWHEMNEKISLPSALNDNADEPVTAAVAGGMIWIIQSGGRLWRGEVLYTTSN